LIPNVRFFPLEIQQIGTTWEMFGNTEADVEIFETTRTRVEY